jgi:hypothetical protein
MARPAPRVSNNFDLVCVLNSGKVNGVACYKVNSTGLKPFGGFHSLGLNETTPPTGPVGTASQIKFSEDGSKMRVSVKGVPGGTDGFIATWDVDLGGAISTTSTLTSPPSGDGLLPFGMANVVGVPSAVLVTDPALGLTIYNFSGSATEFIPFAIDGEQLACWVDYSPASKSYFISDLFGIVFQVSVDTNTLESTLVNTFDLPVGYNSTDLTVASTGDIEYVIV